MELRVATAPDVIGVARLAASVVPEAGSAAEWCGRLSRDVAERDRSLFVAVLGSALVGYTRLGLVQSEASAPDGWYLLGLIVSPEHRRTGVAAGLIRLAAAEASRRTDVLWSFYDVGNDASCLLHARLGFREVARGCIGFPGLSPDSRDVLVRMALRGDPADPPP